MANSHTCVVEAQGDSATMSRFCGGCLGAKRESYLHAIYVQLHPEIRE
jgi:hypothetical protein